MITSKRFRNPARYFEIVKSFLLKNEVENNLALGILDRSTKRKRNPNDLFIVSKENEVVVFIVIKTANNLILVGEIKYLKHVIDFLLSEGIIVNGLIAQSDLGKAFAELWEARVGKTWKIKMNQRIYKLDKLNEVKTRTGNIRIAYASDEEILIEWFKDFFAEIGEDVTEDKTKEVLLRHLSEDSLFVWEDGIIVSMIRKTRPTENGIVVTNVFTPKEFRNKGYATSCVHAFSKMLLKKYQFCLLYTDLANPTSNGIYKKIGYRPIADSIVIGFND